MFDSPELAIWNLTDGGSCAVGAQRVFNVVGALKAPPVVRELAYSLNGRPAVPVYFARATGECERLAGAGQFNVDTIALDDLRPDNEIRMLVRATDGSARERSVRFRARRVEPAEPRFRLELDGVEATEQVGQIVDGRWRVSRDREGRACLCVLPEDAGYDRIVLFGNREWSSGYEVSAAFRVTAWTGARDHGLGLAFKWNPHLQGEGRRLPSQWSTGLGLYYFPKTFTKRGLRISVGEDVHFDREGRYRGERLLGQAMLSPVRWLSGTLRSHLLGLRYPTPQIPAGRSHRFRLRVGADRYTLAVWRGGRPEPPPLISVPAPPGLLPTGSVGVIAHHCAVQVTELEVAPLGPGERS